MSTLSVQCAICLGTQSEVWPTFRDRRVYSCWRVVYFRRFISFVDDYFSYWLWYTYNPIHELDKDNSRTQFAMRIIARKKVDLFNIIGGSVLILMGLWIAKSMLYWPPVNGLVPRLYRTHGQLNGTRSTPFGKSLVPNIVNNINFIDVDLKMLPVDVLYDKLKLVTSFSQNHFTEGMGFIGSAQKTMPNKTVVFYDLGLSPDSIKEIKSFCNVEYRLFPFEKYPPHVRRLLTYAFKPIIINLVLNEFGSIYYADSSIRFNQSVKLLLPNALKHHGFVPHIRCFDPKIARSAPLGCYHDYFLTKPEMYPKVGVNRTELYLSNFSVPAISGGLMLVVNSTILQTKIMRPWLACALNESCVAPHGASLQNHRFDQSALTLLVYKHMRREWTLENDPTPLHEQVVRVARGTNGYKLNPQKCTK